MSYLPQQHSQSWVWIDTLPRESAVSVRPLVRRRITPQAGRGLEMLGHALEYLTDEFVRDGCRFAADAGRLGAIRLLASMNREIYLGCGIEPGIRARVQLLFRRVFKQANRRD